MSGVYVIARSIWDHPMFKRERFTEREAWMWLLGEAAWCEKRVRVNRSVIELKRGQLAHARSFLASKWQWDESSVRRFLDRLVKDRMIDRLATSETTILTICNYDDYQFGQPADDRQNGQPATGPRPQEEELKNLRTVVLEESARERVLSDDCFSIAREIGIICGFPEPVDWPAGWSGAHMRVQTWLNEGWTKDQILGGVKHVAGTKRDGPPQSINYFDKPIASFIARQTAPVPKVKIIEPETVNVIREAKADSKSQFRAAVGDLKEYVARPRGGEGGEVVRLLPSNGDRRPQGVSGGSD